MLHFKAEDQEKINWLWKEGSHLVLGLEQELLSVSKPEGNKRREIITYSVSGVALVPRERYEVGQRHYLEKISLTNH